MVALFSRKYNLLGIIFLWIVFIFSILLFSHAYFSLNKPITVPKEGIIFELVPGTSMQALSRELSAQGIISYPHYFEWFARFKRVSTRLQAGEYFLSSNLSSIDILQHFVTGNVVQHAFTIVEGWTIKQLLEALKNVPFLEHTLSNDIDKIIKILSIEYTSLEGLFLPDTYYFPRGAKDVDILRRSYAAMQEYLLAAWSERAKSLPYRNSYEALIAASLIEKEAYLDAEKPLISGVLVRRLAINMYLQMDASVIYGLGEKYSNVLRSADLRQDTPYNTYRRKGLPPTPIALPSRVSINAALHPMSGKYLYYVSKNDGSHQFSNTLQEHNQAVDIYQRKKGRQ